MTDDRIHKELDRLHDAVGANSNKLLEAVSSVETKVDGLRDEAYRIGTEQAKYSERVDNLVGRVGAVEGNLAVHIQTLEKNLIARFQLVDDNLGSRLATVESERRSARRLLIGVLATALISLLVALAQLFAG